ncbi:FAD-dependent monooxygenase [Streptomyces sp. NPDC050560]|uniref:FAD-dependent monooxygenase n=1 Tax=Streptomyces sp. NPDC050560 TaxID=3365630 RepID=UPI00378F09E8
MTSAENAHPTDGADRAAGTPGVHRASAARGAGGGAEGPPPMLVAGAGPVGLTLAHELARHGVRVRIVDARRAPVTTSRAIATHPRTLETYAQMGIVDEVLPLGQRVSAFTLFQNGKRLTRLEADYGRTPTRYPFTLTITQVRTESVLRAALARRGVEVEWDTRLDAFEHDAHGVRARLAGPGGTEEVDVPWLVGCDGGHSVVRKRLGLRLLGEQSETWMLADARVDTELPRHSIYWVRTGGTTLMMVPLSEPGRWRLLDTSRPPHDEDPGRVAGRMAAMLSSGTGGTVRVGRPDWVSVFTFQQRMVERMRVGRCLVAGDAAHVHSPASGQGMNTGIQEAYNVAWKLAAVVHGRAPEELLDSYGEERVPVGRSLLDSTKTATRLIQLRNPVLQRALPVFFALVRTVPALRRHMQHKILGTMSGLEVNYAASSLSLPEDGAPAPRPGDRVSRITAESAGSPGPAALLTELAGTRWTLLWFRGAEEGAKELANIQARQGSWLSVRTVVPEDVPDVPSSDAEAVLDDGSLRRALGAEADSWLLVRPDGYLSARGVGLTEDGFAGLLARLPLAADG